MRHAKDFDKMRSIKNFQHSDEYYRSLLWMAPEKLKTFCQDLLDGRMTTVDTRPTYETIQIETRDKLKREQSVSLILTLSLGPLTTDPDDNFGHRLWIVIRIPCCRMGFVNRNYEFLQRLRNS